ncbi:hypothetical protein [Nocardioides limicola]|uniref:hypothetical protein n=1 Tax=Nocardioides limicola TaxID=2803368 RepID=UPI00193B1C85|nr:hypothetical protein [Nocardioides sp. DJM-14]
MSTPAVQYRRRTKLAEAAGRRARLTVAPRPRPSRASRVPFMTLVTLLLIGGVVGLLLFNTSMQQASFAATSLEHQARVLTAQEQTLRMELDTLRDPQRVAETAQRMGMVPATSPAFLDLATGRVLGEPRPATPQDGIRIQPLPTPKPRELSPPPRIIEVAPPTRAERRAQRQADRLAEQRAERRAARRGGGGE